MNELSLPSSLCAVALLVQAFTAGICGFLNEQHPGANSESSVPASWTGPPLVLSAAPAHGSASERSTDPAGTPVSDDGIAPIHLPFDGDPGVECKTLSDDGWLLWMTTDGSIRAFDSDAFAAHATNVWTGETRSWNVPSLADSKRPSARPYALSQVEFAELQGTEWGRWNFEWSPLDEAFLLSSGSCEDTRLIHLGLDGEQSVRWRDDPRQLGMSVVGRPRASGARSSNEGMLVHSLSTLQAVQEGGAVLSLYDVFDPIELTMSHRTRRIDGLRILNCLRFSDGTAFALVQGSLQARSGEGDAPQTEEYRDCMLLAFEPRGERLAGHISLGQIDLGLARLWTRGNDLYVLLEQRGEYGDLILIRDYEVRDVGSNSELRTGETSIARIPRVRYLGSSRGYTFVEGAALCRSGEERKQPACVGTLWVPERTK